MVVVLKFNEIDQKTYRIIAGTMINIETGIEYYNLDGEFKGSRKPFNEYNYKDIKFICRPVFGEIIIITRTGQRGITVPQLDRVLTRMIDPYANPRFIPINYGTSRHTAVERKKNFDRSKHRSLFAYSNIATVNEKKILNSESTSKWKILFGLPYLKKLKDKHALDRSPSTIIVDLRDAVNVPTGYKTLNRIPLSKYNFYKRYCRKKIHSLEIEDNICRLQGVTRGVEYPRSIFTGNRAKYLEWNDVKLVKRNYVPLAEQLTIMDYKTQLLIDGYKEKPLKCYVCDKLVSDRCVVHVYSDNFHIISHYWCKPSVESSYVYYTICPQTLLDILPLLKIDENTRDFLEGLYLNNRVNIYVGGVQGHTQGVIGKNKIFIERSPDQMLYTNKHLHGFTMED